MATEATASPPTSSQTAAPTKLELENQSLKRRLVQYAATLEKITAHAKREIDSSARARDEALAAAADADALRDSMAAAQASLADADEARRQADASLRERDAHIADLQAINDTVQARVDGAARREGEVTDVRERLAAHEAEVAVLREERAAERGRAETLLEELAIERGRAAEVGRLTEKLAVLEGEQNVVVKARDASDAVVAEMMRKEEAVRAERDAMQASLADVHKVVDQLHDQVRHREHALKLSEDRLLQVEIGERELDRELRERKLQANETSSALRKELDRVLAELADKNTALDDMHDRLRMAIDAENALKERDQLHNNISQLQDELEQSTEMLTRAAIDALGDKGRIRKLEESVSKARDLLAIEKKEKLAKESKVISFSQENAKLERELDQLRNSKRVLADECHKYQMQIHEQEALVATKSRALDALGTDRNDRAFQADRLSLEVSNAKNSLAKKESEFVNLSSEYSEVVAQLKTSSNELDQKHSEINSIRRELTASTEQITSLLAEKERVKSIQSDLQTARRQVQDLTALSTEKEEELSTIKRWYTTMKSEAGESLREKKRLSDMLSDVSGDLKRANQELDILRNMRNEREALEARLSHISETSSREIYLLRQTQSEHAETLAKNTVDEYHRRLEEMQTSTTNDIAATVTNQLRNDIMPQLMRAVDMKAKHLVHSLAKHVEAFDLNDTANSFSGMEAYPSTRGSKHGDGGLTEGGGAADTNLATAYATASASVTESRTAPLSAYASAPPSAPHSAIPSNFNPSGTVTPSSAPGQDTDSECEGAPPDIDRDLLTPPDNDRDPLTPPGMFEQMAGVGSRGGSGTEAQSDGGEDFESSRFDRGGDDPAVFIMTGGEKVEELDLTEEVKEEMDSEDDFEDSLIGADAVYGEAVVEELPDELEEIGEQQGAFGGRSDDGRGGSSCGRVSDEEWGRMKNGDGASIGRVSEDGRKAGGSYGRVSDDEGRGGISIGKESEEGERDEASYGRAGAVSNSGASEDSAVDGASFERSFEDSKMADMSFRRVDDDGRGQDGMPFGGISDGARLDGASFGLESHGGRVEEDMFERASDDGRVEGGFGRISEDGAVSEDGAGHVGDVESAEDSEEGDVKSADAETGLREDMEEDGVAEVVAMADISSVPALGEQLVKEGEGDVNVENVSTGEAAVAESAGEAHAVTEVESHEGEDAIKHEVDVEKLDEARMQYSFVAEDGQSEDGLEF